MSEPGQCFTATAAAYDGTEPTGSAGLEDCGATDDDADEEGSSIFACRIIAIKFQTISMISKKQKSLQYLVAIDWSIREGKWGITRFALRPALFSASVENI